MSHRDHSHSEQALRTEALESLLVEKGILQPELIDAVVSRYEHDVGPMLGARAVARAWVDAEFKQRLLGDAKQAFRELGVETVEDARVVVAENTPQVHNVVVCTLCSCYPWGVLGLPPTWYKEPAYRSRVVREPRVVLQEFGLSVPESTEVRVWDSSAEVRYLVLPQRPNGSEGLSEEELAGLVTRDSMIGTGLPAAPGEQADAPGEQADAPGEQADT
jgi:nitrile hydratase